MKKNISIKVAHITAVSDSLHLLLLEQLRFLQEYGFSVTGISSSGPSAEFVTDIGIRYVPIEIARTIRPIRDLKSLWDLYRVFRREQFVIIHTHNPKPGLIGQIAAKLARTPIIINTVHGFYFHENMPFFKRTFFMALERIAATCSDLILTQNQEDMDFALRRKFCSPHKIRYLGNGINLELFDPSRITEREKRDLRSKLDLPQNTLVVGFVGRLAARRKGFLDFLAAAQQISQQVERVSFLIIGETDHGKPDAVDPSVASEYGISHLCKFLGWQPNSKLPSFYSLMNVLVLPSLFEGIPRAIMEASAMKVPVVATNVKGNREAVESGRNGTLVPLGNVKALTEAVVEILVDKTKAQQMAEQGRQKAVESFDERLVFEKVKVEYLRLLEYKGMQLPSPEILQASK